MKILRIANVQINSSTNMDVKFTEKLNKNIGVGNIKILSDFDSVPDSEVLEVKILGDVLNITCQPLTPLSSYFLYFISTSTAIFASTNNQSRIIEDNISNKYLITAPLTSDNPIKRSLVNYLKDNIYKVEEDSTIVSKYVDGISTVLARALYDIKQVKNENYLSFEVQDEKKIRGNSPFDRLNEESAYQITRVGRTPTSFMAPMELLLSNINSSPITLQQSSHVENFSISSVDEIGKFNTNTLVFTFTKSPVTKIYKIVFTLLTDTPIYEYNIMKLGYQIKNSRYDKEYGFDYALLKDNQIKLNSEILEDSNFSVKDIAKIEVQYQYKDLGRIIDPKSLQLFSIKKSVREVLPSIAKVVYLKHSPIVDESGNFIDTNNIVFEDPNQISDGYAHSSFKFEIPFRLNALPSQIGQYSVDYENGTLYVYGSDVSNQGTDPYPPLATYFYKYFYKSDQDFVYDSDLCELVALPKGNLIGGKKVVVTFDYENVLIPGLDYVAQLHIEELNERVENRLIALNAVKTKHTPITNVFRILNETSGEIYSVDRWYENKIYFRYINPPNISKILQERVAFNQVNNENLFIDSYYINAQNIKVLRILFANNSIINKTEDGIGSFINSSIVFSNTDIFSNEKWYNQEFSYLENIDNLILPGQYSIDYINGIVYCATNNQQGFNLGTVSYKTSEIVTNQSHLISIEDIYYQTDILSVKNKNFPYISFTDNKINLNSLEKSDESFLNNDLLLPYQVYNNIVGCFTENTFITGVSNYIKNLRSIYEYQDLLNNTNPINFASFCTFNEFTIKVGEINKQIISTVQYDGNNYFVPLDQTISYLSPNISYSFSVIRNSDSAQLWSGNVNNIELGNPVKLLLTDNNPAEGELITITYTILINDLSRVVVDYDKGSLFVDYTYLADEIVLSYEYGDNALDFRMSKTVPENTTYYVSYKVGALRDALLKNFGTLIDIPELSNFDIEFDREQYRDSLAAGLSSFIQGPTVSAIKNIGKIITHIEPEIIESIFSNWSLGSSLLYPQKTKINGKPALLPGKFGNGILIDQGNQNITLPASSNLRLEEGSFECWISPHWNGIDNKAPLTFEIFKNNNIINPTCIFIGASEQHPQISGNKFVIDNIESLKGIPNFNKDGIYIYYDTDISQNFDRWYVKIIDGYNSDPTSSYKLQISGAVFYDVKKINFSNANITSGLNKISAYVSGGSPFEGVFTFIADTEHYIIDVAKEEKRNRLSIYKDVAGYLNFKMYDKGGFNYIIAHDISSWKKYQWHHVAASWKLNSDNHQDEMHLFVDGFEVPNITKYGQKLQPYFHEKFRTINEEEVLDIADKSSIFSSDLTIQQNSNIVKSSINFSAYGIEIGDTIIIDEIGFDTSGYIINNINGQELELNTSMPLTIVGDGRFYINKQTFIVPQDTSLYSNLLVTILSPIVLDNSLTGLAGDNFVSSSIDFELLNIHPGNIISIKNNSLKTIYTITKVEGSVLWINDILPIDINNPDFIIYDNEEKEIPGINSQSPSYSVGESTLTMLNNVLKNDLIVLRTLGLNHRKVKEECFIWSDYENIIMTHLPPPVDLRQVLIKKIILPLTFIGPSNSSILSGQFVSNNLVPYSLSNTPNGRTIEIEISGVNVDFSSSPVQVNIFGSLDGIPLAETINFSDYGATTSLEVYDTIDYVSVTATPININKNALNIFISEKNSITVNETDGYAASIRYSYPINSGITLYKDSDNSVRDENNLFSYLCINSCLYISSPIDVAGFYRIVSLSSDRKSIFIENIDGTTVNINSFSEGHYSVLHSTDSKSGVQNGFFTLEINNQPGVPYLLTKGTYQLEYYTYSRIELDICNSLIYFGNNFKSSSCLDGIIDEIMISSEMLKDIRVGEDINSKARSVTKNFNSLKPVNKNFNTLVLLDNETLPPINRADTYCSGNPYKLFSSNFTVSDNFKDSLIVTDHPLIILNEGILNSKKEGSIEFWVSPLLDTHNDYENRFYFDAFGAVIEELTSFNNVTVKLPSSVQKVISVTLKDNPEMDYFIGGKLSIDDAGAVLEEVLSTSNASITVSKDILQVISITVKNDLSKIEYVTDLISISEDRKSIYLDKLLPYNSSNVIVVYTVLEPNKTNINPQIIKLNKKLPYHNSKVIVKYIPKGLQGDRISVFKDKQGFINFGVTASGTDYLIRREITWHQSSWHRIKATYRFNSKSADQINLFVDGYQCDDILYGKNLITGTNPVIEGNLDTNDGYSISSLLFKDSINTLFIGSQYDEKNCAYAIVDNLRISNIIRPTHQFQGETVDINYNSNLQNCKPVTTDLYTTYLLDFDNVFNINDNFSLIKNKKTGLFDFSVNIFDSFGIVNNIKVRSALEKLIKVLKPANSKVFIQYIK